MIYLISGLVVVFLLFAGLFIFVSLTLGSVKEALIGLGFVVCFTVIALIGSFLLAKGIEQVF